MRNTLLVMPCVFALTVCASVSLQAQVLEPSKDFLIDPNRAFIYLKFDKMGKGATNERDSATRIWFHLTNNSRVPIIVSTFGLPEGDRKDEQGVMYDVVPTVVNGILVLTMPETTMMPGTTCKAQKPSPKTAAGEPPRGTMSDVGSFQSIPPGRAILFSIPINHLGKRWHIEIPFRFDLPGGKRPRDPNIGGQPSMVITYSVGDLPPRYQAAFEKELK